MKKNGEYVGVDEKFIPEDEKYVNDTNNIVEDFINDKDNQEKIKKGAKKGIKIFLGLSIFHFILVGIFFLIIISVFVFIFFKMAQVDKEFDKGLNEAKTSNQNIIDKAYEQYYQSSFNSRLEMYKGSQYGSQVDNLISEIVEILKKNTDKKITIIYSGNEISDVSEIDNLIGTFEQWTKYVVTFDYDENGLINKATIRNR